jgi:hypothetical protein
MVMPVQKVPVPTAPGIMSEPSKRINIGVGENFRLLTGQVIGIHIQVTCWWGEM